MPPAVNNGLLFSSKKSCYCLLLSQRLCLSHTFSSKTNKSFRENHAADNSQWLSGLMFGGDLEDSSKVKGWDILCETCLSDHPLLN